MVEVLKRRKEGEEGGRERVHFVCGGSSGFRLVKGSFLGGMGTVFSLCPGRGILSISN